jgi:exoribonuclease R
MKIAGVLDVCSKTKYGMTSRGVPMYLFTPLNADFPQMICASSVRMPTKNVLVLVEQLTQDGTTLPRGKILSYIGECGDVEAERNAVHHAYSPEYWSAFPDIVEPNIPNRAVLDVDTVNIDPPGCQDIDDCISFWDEHVAITIADVAEWIHVNPWMKKACKIGQTLYMDGMPVRKLFPHEYRMSLVPGEARYGVALMFDFVAGCVLHPKFEEVVILNKKSYTYDSCHEWKYAARLRVIAEHLAGKPLSDPHEWIEQFMLFYNRQAAACLASMGTGLLRGHTPPDMEKVARYESIGLPGHLAYSGACYVPATQHIEHWGIGGIYCHATSPIRRYADCINQMSLKGMDNDASCADNLNTLQRYAKKHARDLLFIEECSNKRTLTGTIVNARRIWCHELKCMITCENAGGAGDKVTLEYFYNPNKPTWKTRLVFRVSDTNCTSSPLQESV